MPFRSKGAATYKHRVALPGGRSRICSCGTRFKTTANAVAAFVRSLKERRDTSALEAIVDGRVTLTAAYDAYQGGNLGVLLSEARDRDLSPLVTEWAGGGNAKYLLQVRRFIPAAVRFPVSQFRRAGISRFLATLTDTRTNPKKPPEEGEEPKQPAPAKAATRNRYRAALSVFAKWLVEREIIETNVVRDVAAARVPRRPIAYLEPEQVRTLVDGLPEPYRAVEAMMAGTGLEWGAVQPLRRRDIDIDARTLYAHGTKTGYRARYVEVTEDWAWQILLKHIETLTPNAPLFPGVKKDGVLKMHRRVSKRLGLPMTTVHEHRHAFAVMHLKRGCDHQWLKNQLGHAPQSVLLYTTYGVYIGAARLSAAQEHRMRKSNPNATAGATTIKVVSR